jgi:hypothetical protein
MTGELYQWVDGFEDWRVGGKEKVPNLSVSGLDSSFAPSQAVTGSQVPHAAAAAWTAAVVLRVVCMRGIIPFLE